MNAPPQHPLPAIDRDDAGEAEPVSSRLGRWLAVARRAPGLAGRAAISLMYPPVCAACGASTGEPHGLCARCWASISFISRPYCERLGTPFAVDLGGKLLSPAAMADPPAFDRARAVAAYDDIARELIHRLKYGDRLELAHAMGGLMALSGRELIADTDLIVPVPLHRWRIWTRRFNQAAALGRVIGAAAGKPVAGDILRRVKRTRPQVGLSRNERAENLQGALRVAAGCGHRLEGRRVLLVDDVLTTGATANAAARALLRGGASAVDILTFARVIPGA